ncbi:MAG: CopG family transcriptional regulator [Castellaniella sp.]|uniref:ribbon-helix-helix domain-containing protein n=1 Tax=Castellaniella sp. TaxID=1955812 RepID=UPI00120649C1|nr:CopG family transcriptional regulator [Castellaniella sp.]TAN25448.1 MAG: CopG family transcriptional regulator [Castellaniella sp.]
MSTTTIPLSEDLKTRVATAARKSGVTAHHFILEAIEQKTRAAERQADFEAGAEARYARIVESGLALSWADMRAYLESSMGGRTAVPPTPRRLAK